LEKQTIAELLGEWEGYELGTVGRREVDGKPQVWIELLPRQDGPPRICGGCGKGCGSVHEVEQRWVKDLPILECPTYLLVHRVRLNCPTCGGPKLQRLSWLEPYARVTSRLAASVARLCKVTSVKHAAAFYGLDWKTAKAIDKAHLEKELGPVDEASLAGVEVIAMDEFATHKGQRYATVVLDPRTKRVLWVGKGHGREDVRPFFELLGEAGRRRLKAVVIDMNGAYEAEVRAQCPSAAVVYDLFHVVAKYGHEVIDRVRVDEANRLRHDKPARKVIKGSRWLLLRNRDNIKKEEDRVRLDELLAANRKLMKAYVLKDDLKALWDYRHTGYAKRFWDGWYARAVRSRIEPLKRFALKLKGYLGGILNHCRWPLHTSVLEGVNNKIKVIKRMAYGFRDDDYFFLKIRAAFPGVGR
jgi:transposase